jgi:hypothetical protein
MFRKTGQDGKAGPLALAHWPTPMRVGAGHLQNERGGRPLRAVACGMCGTSFSAKNFGNIYCSRECGWLAKRKPQTIVCAVCNQTHTYERFRDAGRKNAATCPKCRMHNGPYQRGMAASGIRRSPRIRTGVLGASLKGRLLTAQKQSARQNIRKAGIDYDLTEFLP